ncbi:MAG: DUF1501 domain-containing protein [Planctomycetota bacterium]|jgi:uncharacterized protein (DUF1501 family)
MHLTRRFFLQSSGALAAYLGISPLELLGRPARPLPIAAVTPGKTLVVIFLRGGADGVNLVVPHGDPYYNAKRASIAIDRPGGGDGAALDLDGFYGLHPRLEPLMKHFDAGHGLAAHAVGYDKNTRSHFEEQDVWETGIIGNTVNSDGWVNRHLATSIGEGRIRAVAIGDTLPRILHGEAPAYAIRGIDELTLPRGRNAPIDAITAALEHAYCTPPREHVGGATDLLSRTASTTLEGIKELRSVMETPYAPAAAYPQGQLGQRLRQVARLVKAGIGLEVAEVDFGGWDTHQNQGQGAGGVFGNLAGELGGSIDAFLRDVEDHLDDVLVVTVSDFGRTAAENGTRGTDHGWANCMFLFGGAVAHANAASSVADRRVHADWPGMAEDQLNEKRDLLHTTDFRDVLAEIVRIHLGNPNLGAILPDHVVKPIGLVG